MLTLLAATLTLATPTTGLTLSAERGKAGAISSSSYVDSIEQELIASKVAVLRIELACKGQRACLVGGAKKASLPALVAVTVASGRQRTTLDLEAIRIDDGATVAQVTFDVTGRLGDADRARVRAFAAQLAEAITQTDRPNVEPVLGPPVLLPTPPPTPPLVVAPVEKRSNVPAVMLGGGAVAAGVSAGVLFAIAGGTRAQLEATPNPSTLKRANAEALVGRANDEYTASLVLGLAAGTLAVGAIVWLATN